MSANSKNGHISSLPEPIAWGHGIPEHTQHTSKKHSRLHANTQTSGQRCPTGRLGTIVRVSYIIAFSASCCLLMPIRLLLGLLFSSLDTSIVATSLVTISHDLNDFINSPWIVLSYLLTYMGSYRADSSYDKISADKR